jgi:hypothetical protein
LLQLDSLNTYADTATCATTTNQGAFYYNTNSAAIRSCVNGTWEDVVTTSGLGILTYGVIPDSGPTPGDIAGVNATDASDGPCKVYMGSVANSVRWTGCTVYTNGRKQVSPGFTVKLNGTLGQFTPTAATTDPFSGIVAAWSGTTQTTAINAILVTNGPAYVKASAGSVGAYINPTATTGIVSTTALITAAPGAPDAKYIPYTFLGLAQSAFNAPGTQCSTTANADTCRGSLLVNVNIR